MTNIYNAIQNLYNMDKETWQEVLSEMYTLVNNTSLKFDTFEQKFLLHLGNEVTKELKKMYNDGRLGDLINDVLLKDINEKVDTFKTEVSEQLETKANKTDIFTMANMGQDIKEAMTGGSVGVVAPNSILKVDIVNRQVTSEKTDFIENTGNLINPKYCVNGRLYADGLVHTDTENDLTCLTTDYIEVKENQTIYFSLKNGGNPKAYMGKAFLYNINMVKDSEITSLITLDSTNKFATYKPSKSGFIRFSSESGIKIKDRCLSKISNKFIEFEERLSRNIKIDMFENYATFDEVKNISTNSAETVFNKNDKLLVGKNKVDDRKCISGFIDTENGTISSSTAYKTTDFIYIEKGQSCTISPKCRKFLSYDTSKKPKTTTYQNDTLQNYTFTADEDCYVRFSYSIDDENRTQLELGNEVTAYEVYCYKSPVPIKAPNIVEEKINEDTLIKNNLYGKIIVGVGDSIMYGDGWRGGFLKIIGEKNKMTYQNYGIGGTTIAKRSNETSDTSIVGRISSMRDDADFILLEGGANDVVKNVPLGEITSGYDAIFDEYTFCGAMESMLKQALNKWVGKKIVFITVHKMKSRGTILTTYLEKAKEICEKWCIEVIDIHNKGGLNTNIDIYKELYTAGNYADGSKGDSTHPNELGYRTFYVSPIEKSLS